MASASNCQEPCLAVYLSICTEGLLPVTAAACIEKPNNNDMPENAQWDCGQTASGDSCNATCAYGYKAAVSSSWGAVCSRGEWGVAAPAGGEDKLMCKPSSECHMLAAHHCDVLARCCQLHRLPIHLSVHH